MKITLFSILTFLVISLQASYGRTLIVSDIDDTIKMSGILNSKVEITYHGLFTKKAFAGMSELYQELSNEETSINYVSGSPQLIRSRVESFLDHNDFPQAHNLILRRSLFDDTVVYKTIKIRELIKKHNPDKIIMIGDDTEHDPEIFQTIYEENADKVESIYIRAIQNRQMPNVPVIRNFFSAVELAGLEFINGRIDKKSFYAVVNGFLEQTKNTGIYLKKHYCPKEGREQLEEIKHEVNNQRMIDLLEQTQKKIIQVCQEA